MRDNIDNYTITDNSDSRQAWRLREQQAVAIRKTTGLILTSTRDCEGTRGFELRGGKSPRTVLIALEWDDCSHDLYLLVEGLELYLTCIDPALA